MLRKSFTISILCLSLMGLFFVSAISAQTDLCNLKLLVKENETDKSGSGATIDGAAGKAVNSETNEIIKAVDDNGELFFKGFRKWGKYTLTIKKSGYKRTVFEQVINCSPEFPDLSGIIPMQKGNSKETFVPDDVRIVGAFQVGTFDSESLPADSGEPPTPPVPQPPQVPKLVSKGVINGSAILLARPEYPAAAKAAGASGAVSVQVMIDETGKVVSATALNGHPLLRTAAVDAARASRFRPTLLKGQPVKVSGIMVYNFQ